MRSLHACVAKNSDKAAELIEDGFEYVTAEYGDGGKLFRKRKLTYLGSVSTSVGSWFSLDVYPTGEIPRKLPHFSCRCGQVPTPSKVSFLRTRAKD